MRKVFAISGLFLLFILFGGVWVSLVRLIPAGAPRTTVIVLLGVAFVVVFVGLLVSRVRRILAGTHRFWVEMALVLAEVSLLVLAFASMYQKLGIVNNTGRGPPLVTDYLTCVYYSIVTFTTLGYGDFYPVGLGRPLAALEAITGYVILGVLASTAAAVISPYTRAGLRSDDEDR